ncbi:hypothetical protein LQU94_06315 [Peptoniphilus sp. KCTC 25270]|uniref:hypothetical protein n=1 Tax=Peptoniphilus sp. KCTC 25270 TaxID=2897414 RepID=UPI001E350AE2|nr:hypothetical protein [Peptoniphilus sp. KCTC 25270]MCD1147724.1 hypothetical protein [Peptoniphilus sp. KCTC 25270]
MKPLRIKEILFSVVLFALLCFLSLEYPDKIRPLLPGVALLFALGIVNILAQNIHKNLGWGVGIFSLLLYPLTFDFFHLLPKGGYYTGWFLFFFLLYFSKLLQLFYEALYGLTTKKLGKIALSLLISLVFAFGIYGLNLDKAAFFSHWQTIDFTGIQTRIQNPIWDKILLFFTVHWILQWIVLYKEKIFSK